MFTTATRPQSPWDVVEHAILRAVQQPTTCLPIAEDTGLTPDVVKTQLATFHGEGLVTQPVPGSGRYQLTLTGFKRLFELANTSATVRAA